MSLKVKLHWKTSTSTAEDEPLSQPDQRRLANARSGRSWRARLEEDPVKWAEFKADEAARAKEYRRNRSSERREHEKERNRERQKRFVANRKLLKPDSQFSTPGKKHPKILTRSEKTRKRDYDKEKKREERATMSAQKKRRVRERDAQRKREKRQKTRCSSASPAALPSTTAQLNIGSRFKTPAAKRMAISRMWKIMPKDADKFADIIVDFVKGGRSTPRKQAALRARGFRACRREMRFEDPSDQHLHLTIQNLKRKSDSASLRNRRLLVSSLMVAKKYRKQGMLARRLDLRPGYLTNISKSAVEGLPSSRTRKRRADATCMDAINSIQAFLKEPAIARELPCMRTVVKQQQRFVMEVSMQQAYNLWKVENPEYAVVSFAVFARLRPSNVQLQHKITLNQCLCEYCTDVLLKLQCLNRSLQAMDYKALKIKDKYDLVSLSMCAKLESTRYHRPECIDRTCSDCGVSLLENSFQECLEVCGDKAVTWQKWETQAYIHDGKRKSKKVLATKTGTFRSMFQELLVETAPLAKHLFTASWQQGQFTTIRGKLPDNWSLFVLDFAENYACISQDEIQSAHWAIQQVTVHPIVCYYKCNEEEHTHLVQEALVFLSDDLTHDSHAVHHFESLAVKHLQEKRGLNFQHIVEFTDGCSGQYKSKSPFADISYTKLTHGISFERNFFGSRHGKGPSDGVSGVVKSAVRRAVISRRVTINTAEEMFDYCVLTLTKDCCAGQRRSFYYVPRGEINRKRPTSEVKTAVAGTRNLHSVRCVRAGVIETRLLTCFCGGCLKGEECSNNDYVLPWETRALKMVHEVTDIEETELQPIDEPFLNGEIDEDATAADDKTVEELLNTMTSGGLFFYF